MSDAKPRSLAFDPMSVEGFTGASYPEQFRASTKDRMKRKLGDHGGIGNFGVNMVTLPPGSESALRHAHAKQDEFVYIISGEATLITDDGEQALAAGHCATFPAGNGDGHHLVNKSNADVVYLEVGDRTPGDAVSYPDHDLAGTFTGSGFAFTNKKGEPY